MTLGGLLFMLAVLGALVIPYVDWDKHLCKEFAFLCTFTLIFVFAVEAL